MEQKKGKATVAFARPPVICGAASIVGKKESEGPLGPFFDRHIMDDGKGMENWEQAESSMQKAAADLSITKAGLKQSPELFLNPLLPIHKFQPLQAFPSPLQNDPSSMRQE